MTRFFAMYLVIYGGMNLVMFLRARAALNPTIRGAGFMALWFMLMLTDPMLVRKMEASGMTASASATAIVSYMWMGLVLVFFTATAVIMAYSALSWSALKAGIKMLPALSAKAGFYAPLVIALAVNIYGLWEAWDVKLKHVEVRTSKLPQGIDRIRIAQISDVHVGLIVGPRRIGLIAQKIKDAAPDIVVSTGDFVDGTIDSIERMQGIFASVPARYGKFAVAGNHEGYAGRDRALAFTRGAGFRVLLDESVEIPEAGITIIGEDYRRAGWDTASPAPGPLTEEALIKGSKGGGFRLLLKHIPLVEDKALGWFDLQLSGHTHGGQIFPFSIPVQRVFPRIAGLFDLGGGSMLYVSRGTGTWGPPVRFLSPPEVTLIEVARK